jgi:hypothetical protein
MTASMTASSPAKISSAVAASYLAASCLLVAIAVTVAASGAAAASPGKDKHLTAAKHRGPYATIVMHRARGVRGGREYPNIPPNAIRMPGYIFVPGVGILDESCDLPTSSCPNEYRDVQ